MATPDSEAVQVFAAIRLQQVARLAALQRTYGATFNGLGRAVTARAMIALVRDCHVVGIAEHQVVAALKGTEPALPASDPLRDPSLRACVQRWFAVRPHPQSPDTR